MTGTYAFPLSAHQGPILAHERGCVLGSAYHMVSAHELDGPIGVELLAEAARFVVSRHESLRTVFRDFDGEPCQVVLAESDFALCVVDTSPDRLPEAFAESTEPPFDLAAGPLLRVVLVRTTPRNAVLLLIAHHLVGDGWSLDVLAREVVSAYGSLADGVRPDLPVATQYPDFVLWERDAIPREEIERQIGHWRARTAGTPIEFSLCPDRSRGPHWDNRAETTEFTVGATIADAVAELAARRGATAYMAGLAAFQIALGECCGRDRFVLGSANHRRSGADLASVVGLVANFMVPVPVDLSGGPTYAQVLDRVRAQTVAAMANQDVPVDTLLAVLDPARDSRVPPVLQVGFQLATVEPGPALASTKVRFTPVPVPTRHAYSELTLTVAYDDGLRCLVQWTTAHHDAHAIAALTTAFTAGLAALAYRPHNQIRRPDSGPAAEPSEVH